MHRLAVFVAMLSACAPEPYCVDGLTSARCMEPSASGTLHPKCASDGPDLLTLVGCSTGTPVCSIESDVVCAELPDYDRYLRLIECYDNTQDADIGVVHTWEMPTCDPEHCSVRCDASGSFTCVDRVTERMLEVFAGDLGTCIAGPGEPGCGFACSSSMDASEFGSAEVRCVGGVPTCVITGRPALPTDFAEPRCVRSIDDALGQCAE